MYISYNWLKDYINIDKSPNELANLFNLYGLTVDEIIERKQEFKNVYIAKILEIIKHPNADNLTICKVTDNKEVFNIVCGAKNIKVGDIVPLAKDGAILPGNIKIKTTKIRGVESSGMLCSANELGIADDNKGILILNPEEGMVGEEFISFLPDIIFNLEITPNRPDLLCVTGIARFLSAITGKKNKFPSCNISHENIDRSLSINKKIKVEVKDTRKCLRYTARIIEGIKVMESPLWLKERLKAGDIRPINNIVDITNFVMLELNQPLHAFDYHKIAGGKIVVRNTYDNEKIIALDGKQYELNEDNLIIADSQRPIAIAGIMGGEEFSINDSTNTIILEAAFFDAKSIRKTAKQLNLSSDSSYRFERGIDIENTHKALNRATELIINIAGGKTTKDYIDVYPIKFKRKEIILRYEKINKLLGLQLSKKKINSIIKKLDFKLKKIKSDFLKVQIPGYRVDIKQEIDLIEDITQIYGYENIPATMPVSPITLGRKTRMQSFIEVINNKVTSYGFFNAINYSFINNKLLNQLDEHNFLQENPIFLKNPFNEEENRLKTTLVYDMLKNLISNYHKENENIHLFETGKVYYKDNGKYIEKVNLCLISSGYIILNDYNKKAFKSDFYFLKSVVTNLLNNITDINNYTFVESKINSTIFEYYSNIITNDKIIGKIGKVNQEILYKNKIMEDAFISEINLDFLLDYFPKNIIFKKLSIHPVVKRDISIIVPYNLQECVIEKLIYETGENLIKRMILYDFYKGKQIPDGYKSLTYSLILQSDERTLTDDEINRIISNIINKLKYELKAELRT